MHSAIDPPSAKSISHAVCRHVQLGIDNRVHVLAV